MQPYWIRFEDIAGPSPLTFGAGVTARSKDDAVKLVAAAFPGTRIESLSRVRNVADLEQRHVVANTGNLLERGVWFPLGHETVASDVL